MQNDPRRAYRNQGVIPIDNTLVDWVGMLIPDGWLWDHAEERTRIAQDYLHCQLRLHQRQALPLEFRLVSKQEICEGLERAVPQSYRVVLRVDRLGLRMGNLRPLRQRTVTPPMPRSSTISIERRTHWDGSGGRWAI